MELEIGGATSELGDDRTVDSVDPEAAGVKIEVDDGRSVKITATEELAAALLESV